MPLVSMADIRFNKDSIKIALDAVSNAVNKIDLMMFKFDYKPLADALIAAHDRGVKVRAVIDVRSLTFCMPGTDINVPDYLISHGIETYIYDDVPNILHCKFILIDDYAVITGSQNFFQNDILHDYEMLMRLESQIGDSFYGNIAHYFDTVLKDGHTIVHRCDHKKIFQDTKNDFEYEGKFFSQPFSVHVEQLFFSPETDSKTMVLETIRRATKKIIVMEAFFFDEYTVANALIDSLKRGVEVKVLTNLLKNRMPFHRYLQDNGINIGMYCLDNSLMHHKTILIDDDIVFTGSLNLFPRSLSFDREFAVLIQNEELHQILYQQFQVIWNNPYVMKFCH